MSDQYDLTARRTDELPRRYGEATMTDPTVYYQTTESIRRARASLGNTASLDEAIVSTGIDALLELLDGKQVKFADVGVVELVQTGHNQTFWCVEHERFAPKCSQLALADYGHAAFDDCIWIPRLYAPAEGADDE